MSTPTLAALLAGVVLVPVAVADDHRRGGGVTYQGIGVSRLSTPFDNVDDAVSLDTVMGLRIPAVQWFAAEINLGFTLIPGEVTQATPGSSTGCGFLGQQPCPGSTSSDEDFQAINLGIFGVLRSPGTVYAMGKAGYRYINSNLPELDDNRSGSAWGAGVGYRYHPDGAFVELLYTRLSGELDLIGLSISFGF